MTNSSANLWSRIYLLLYGISIAVMAALTYYSWSWLQSIGAPQAAVEGYLYHSGIAWKFLLISSIALLVLANAVLATSRKPWAMWAAFVYFAAFVVMRSFWLERSFFAFKQDSGLAESSFTLAPIAGVLICVAAGAIVYADQFAMVRLHERMYPEKTEPEEIVGDETLDEADPIKNGEM